jgi:hypothetical protein
MKAKKLMLIYLAFANIGIHQVYSKPWNEEGTSQLGHVSTAHSAADVHSTYHYDLTKLLAIKAGLSEDLSETLARYCVLVDQINPKSNYPYPLALNTISIPDTYTGWNESLAGTERGNPQQNNYKEYPPQYWHFPYRDPNDTLSGGMTFGIDYPLPENLKYRDAPYYWRVPLLNNYNLLNIKNWALYSTGSAGQPDNTTPCLIYFYDNILHQYKKVQPGSVQAMGIYLHSLADSYSHEHCMVNDTLRSHPSWSDACGLTYHSHHEFAYDTAMFAMEHSTPCVQALWRAIIEYKAQNNITTTPLWTTDSNGFEDGDGIPDELENDRDAVLYETFLEKWEAPTEIDFNEDGILDHFDQTSWRIYQVNSALNPIYRIIELNVFLEALYAGNHKMGQAHDQNGVHFTGKVSDQLIIELHNALNYNTISYTDTVHLFSNGRAHLFLPIALTGNFYITVKHRNSIAITSALPVLINQLTQSYDFTINASSVYDANVKYIEPDVYAMYAGDANGDGFVDILDVMLVENAATTYNSGYIDNDLNGDGCVDALDLVLVDNNAVNFVAYSHPSE